MQPLWHPRPEAYKDIANHMGSHCVAFDNKYNVLKARSNEPFVLKTCRSVPSFCKGYR